MKRLNTHKESLRPLVVSLGVVLVALVAFAMQGTARSSNTINITVTNNTQRTIARLYLAAGDPNNWGPDQLNGSTIPSGASFALDNVACNGSTVRVIAEDQNGCFVYNNASCQANQTWEITSAATPDCGGN